MNLNVLVTNDDGISAPGLEVAEEIARKIAGENGCVTTVAPAIDQSGVGHSISYLRPSLITKLGSNRYSVEGTPADCILAGIYHVLKEKKPDLIISGVNKGHNISEDILYSGTVGAAMEGSLQRIKSISLSQCFSKISLAFLDPFEASRALGYQVCDKLIKSVEWTNTHYNTFYNINFPAVRAKEVQGIAACYQGYRSGGSFSMEAIDSPHGRTFLWINHKPKNSNTSIKRIFKSDLEGIESKYITVTPLKADLTNYEHLSSLEEKINYEY